MLGFKEKRTGAQVFLFFVCFGFWGRSPEKGTPFSGQRLATNLFGVPERGPPPGPLNSTQSSPETRPFWLVLIEKKWWRWVSIPGLPGG